ncbi:hypothetical protein V2J09_006852 [Rumex salicifolius]
MEQEDHLTTTQCFSITQATLVSQIIFFPLDPRA